MFSCVDFMFYAGYYSRVEADEGSSWGVMADMPTNLSAVSAEVVDGKIYVIRGKFTSLSGGDISRNILFFYLVNRAVLA